MDAETELAQGDRLRIVGREADLETVGLLLGHPVQECIHFEHGLESRRVVVSRGTTVGMSLEALNLRDAFNVQVSRVIRSGVELAAEDDTELQMGDRVVLVGDGQALRNVARILGNDYAATQFADLPALLLGLLAGLLLGRVPLHLPGVGGFALGTAGGVLVAGLVLGRLHRTGSFQWRLPAATTSFVRDLGLVLFLASVGTVAGATILDTLRTEGLRLLGCGALITFVPLLIGLLVCRRVGRLPVLRTVGVLSGGMTSTPGLAATAGLSTTSHASSAYATVYPAALLSMILAVKVVVLVLGG